MSYKTQCLLSRRNALKVIMSGAAIVASRSVFSLPTTLEEKENEKMPVIVIVSFETKTEKMDSFNKIMGSVKTDLPKVDGCISVTIFRSSTNKNRFTLVETWESKELHQAHIDKLSKDGTWDMIASHLFKDPKSDYFIEM